VLGFDPHDSSAALLWTQVLLVWTAASYLTFGDPVGHQEVRALRAGRRFPAWSRRVVGRAAAAGTVTALLPGSGAGSGIARAGLAVLVLATLILLPLTRIRMVERARQVRGRADAPEQHGFWVAEWEIAAGAAVASSSWLLISAGGLSIRPWLRVPGTDGHLTVVAGCATLVLWVAGGGSFVVRGVLNKVDALPRQHEASGATPPADVPRAPVAPPADAAGQEVDLLEFSRGRIIGVLERLIVLVLMAVQAYQAIAFLMAAKGLIRSRDLESRDFPEYFLIGTLASMAIALAGGVAVQMLVNAWS
jgi:hypothetical protein